MKLILKDKGGNQDFNTLLILTMELRYVKKEDLTEKGGGGEFWKLFCQGGGLITYLEEGRVGLEDQG